MTGRVKLKLAKKLTQAVQVMHPGIVVDADDLLDAKGHYRTSTSSMNEALRWECAAGIPGSNLSIRIMSYETMTALLSAGVKLSPDDGNRLRLWADREVGS